MDGLLFILHVCEIEWISYIYHWNLIWSLYMSHKIDYELLVTYLLLFRRSRDMSKFKIKRKSFRLCYRDQYGTTGVCDESFLLRMTPLHKELSLRTEAIYVSAFYEMLKANGMHQWVVFHEHKNTIKKSLDNLKHALRRYKSNRIKLGLFYLVPRKDGKFGFIVRSPLLDKPIEYHGKRRIKLQFKKRSISPSITSANVPAANIFTIACSFFSSHLEDASEVKDIANIHLYSYFMFCYNTSINVHN